MITDHCCRGVLLSHHVGVPDWVRDEEVVDSNPVTPTL